MLDQRQRVDPEAYNICQKTDIDYNTTCTNSGRIKVTDAGNFRQDDVYDTEYGVSSLVLALSLKLSNAGPGP